MPYASTIKSLLYQIWGSQGHDVKDYCLL